MPPQRRRKRPLSGANGLRYIAADASQLARGNVFEALAAFVELFVDLDGRFLHHGVRILRPADQQEIIAARKAGMAVVVVKRQA
jgi:hypothetical protein